MLYVDGNPNYDEIKQTRLRTIDSSVSSRVFGFLHDFVLRRTATTVAPSVFTLFSLGLSTAYFLLALRFGSFSEAEYPHWMYALNTLVILVLWLTPTLDERQTRRTGRSSPLSEFLRNGVHGPLSILYTLVLTSSAVRVPFDFQFLLLFWFASVAYFLTLWATYLTGRFEHWFLGPKEVQLFAVVVNGLLAFDVFPHWAFQAFFQRFSLLILLASSFASFYRGGVALKELQVIEIIAGFLLALPVVWIIITSCYWASNINYANGATFTVLLGLLFVYVNSRLVFARICQFASDILYVLLVPLALVAVFPSFYTYFGFADDRTFIFAYLASSFLLLLHFIFSVVDLYVQSCEGQLLTVVPIKRQPKVRTEATEVKPDDFDSRFEEDPEDTEFNPSSEGEDSDGDIESDEDNLEEEEVPKDAQ